MKTQNQHSESTEALPCVQTPVSRSRFVPMLFSTPMVQGIIELIKTETRRTQGLEKINKSPNSFVFKQISDLFYFTNKFTGENICIKSKANIGDIIWIRETFAIVNEKTIYKASVCSPDFDRPKNGWKPSLFMPKKACRLFLEVVSVSVERLQDIDEQSAINEGILKVDIGDSEPIIYKVKKLEYKNYFKKDNFLYTPIASYSTLWAKINGWESWNENPFVWVYKFRSISVPPDFC